MFSAAKEEMLSPSSDPCVFFPLAADPAELETRFGETAPLRKNSRQGFARKNVAPHQGSAWSNSGTALGIEPALRLEGIRSRCTGKERDPESGLDNFGARYYSSSMGRWATPDWSVRPAAIPYAVLGNPQTLNLYSYVGNSPLTHADIDGHCWPAASCVAALNNALDRAVAKVQMNSLNSSPAMAALKTFVAGAAADTVKMIASPLTVGSATGTCMGGNGCSAGQTALAVGGDVLKGAAIAGGVGAVAGKAVSALGEAGSGLADSALVVRGGVPTAAQLTKGAETIAPNGSLSGISVNSANGATVEQLSAGIPNNQIGVTTAGDVRAIGGDVVPDPLPTNPNHCLMCNVDANQASSTFKVQPNPVKVKVEPQ